MRRLFFAVLAFCFLTFDFSFAQAKHPFTFEDMMKLKRVGEPEVSPDGKWVIFSVVDVDLAANTKTPHIWIVSTAGGGSNEKEREIIADQDADRPRWAPDGKRFAFISTKEGGSQVWIADFDGAAGTIAQKYKLTSIATEAGGELWSPDGKNILFTSDVYPECDGAPEAEAACNSRKLKEVERSKVKALIFEHLLYRHWNAYKEGKRSHIFVTPSYAEVTLGCVRDPADPHGFGCIRDRYRDLTPGDYDAPVFSLGGQDDYAFSPDGQEICYTSNHDKNPAASTNNDLWIVPVSGGPAKNITADNPASDSTPLYSPDGRYIAYRAQLRPGYESDRFRLMLYDRKTGEKKSLTDNLDAWVGTFIWSPDPRHLYFSYELAGYQSGVSISIDQPLKLPSAWERGELDLTGYPPTSKPFDDDLAISPDGRTLFFTRMSLRHPSEIFSESLVPSDSGSEDKQLTHFNDEVLARVSMSSLEPFWFTGAHSDKVEGFLVKPPNFDASKKYPVKFLIHGGPEGAWGDDWSFRWNRRTLRVTNSIDEQRLRRHHDQLPRLDRLRAEIYRCY